MGGKPSKNYISKTRDIINMKMNFKLVKEKKFEYNYESEYVLYLYCDDKYASKKDIKYILDNLTLKSIKVADVEVDFTEPEAPIKKARDGKLCKIYLLGPLFHKNGDVVDLQITIRDQNQSHDYPVNL